MVVFNNAMAGAAGSGGAAAGYQIERSLRFNSADSAYLSRGSFANSDTQTMTFSFWVKRSQPSTTAAASQYIFSGGVDGTIYFGTTSDQLHFNLRGTSGTNYFTTTVAEFRDFSAWYHIVVALDLGNSTQSERFKCYVNGVEQAMSATAYPSNNFHAGGTWYIGSYTGTQYYPSFYLADFHYVAGQALSPTEFGEFDATTGVWNPIEYTGTYGTNGFYLPFNDNSSASALGTDASPNGNNWTVNNIDPSGSLTYVPYGWSGIDAYIPAGYTRTQDANDCFVNNNTGVVVNWGTGTPTDGYFGIVPTSSTVTIKWLTYDGSGNTEVTLHTTGAPNFPNPISPSSSTGSATSASPKIGTWTGLTTGTTYYLRSGMVGSGNPNLVLYVTGATLATLGDNPGCDSLFDSPTNGDNTLDTGLGGELSGNYATLNPLDKGGNVTLSNGNLYATCAVPHHTVVSTIQVSSGKYYAEFVWDILEGATYGLVGVANPVASRTNYLGGSIGGVGYNPAGQKWVDGVQTTGLTSSTFGDVIGIALDKDNNQVSFYKNNSLLFTQTGLDSEQPYGFAFGHHSSSGNFNFGQRPFAYTAPSGFKALCTANLPTPDIENGKTVFDTLLWTGNGDGSGSGTSTDRDFTGTLFQPEFAWVKTRGPVGYSHQLTDSVRGVGANTSLRSNDPTKEGADTNGGYIDAFLTDGISTSSAGQGDNDYYNRASTTYAAWLWDGGTSFTNGAGTNGAAIASSGTANQDSGFSITTYSGTGTAGKVYHGLSSVPKMIFIKQRTDSATTGNGDGNWIVGHTGVGMGSGRLILNDTYTDDGGASAAGHWNSTAAESYLFSVGTSGNVNGNGSDYVAYCWAPVEGYSAMGSYLGNLNADGPFIYTGFRPHFILFKNASSGTSWDIYDTTRNKYNLSTARVFPDQTLIETYNYDFLDINSNGFKIRNANTGNNGSGNTIVWAAFAENPFKYARAR